MVFRPLIVVRSRPQMSQTSRPADADGGRDPSQQSGTQRNGCGGTRPSILLKLGFLLAFGPTFVPDTVGYAQYADAILAGRVNDPDLLSGIYPVTLFRVIGYPAVIAAAKWTLHDAWPWGVVALQLPHR